MAEKKNEHTGKKNQVKKNLLKKRMNKIPFGKIPQKAMHKWSVLGNYIRSLLWGSLESLTLN